jgi:hypothetical protein
MVGSGGEVFAAEDDRNGHLWIYFPPEETENPDPSIHAISPKQHPFQT